MYGPLTGSPLLYADFHSNYVTFETPAGSAAFPRWRDALTGFLRRVQYCMITLTYLMRCPPVALQETGAVGLRGAARAVNHAPIMCGQVPTRIGRPPTGPLDQW